MPKFHTKVMQKNNVSKQNVKNVKIQQRIKMRKKYFNTLCNQLISRKLSTNNKRLLYLIIKSRIGIYGAKLWLLIKSKTDRFKILEKKNWKIKNWILGDA